MDIRQRLLAAFEFEHKDHLSAIRTALRAAEETGAPPDIVDIHRRAHSLKGAARAVDLPEVEAIAHRMEAAFIAVQRGAAVLDPDTVAAVRRALDAIEDVVAWSTRGGGAGGTGAGPDEGGAVELSGVLADLDRIAAVRTQSPAGEGAPAPQPPRRRLPGRRPGSRAGRRRPRAPPRRSSASPRRGWSSCRSPPAHCCRRWRRRRRWARRCGRCARNGGRWSGHGATCGRGSRGRGRVPTPCVRPPRRSNGGCARSGRRSTIPTAGTTGWSGRCGAGAAACRRTCGGCACCRRKASSAGSAG
ncbi:hypothetical protein DEW08_02580 [Azospirillum thermophilum]|uniref:HPt domain-containing protein n=1 Tax=Azospirillum thermophilum TaxID=2202148 RepID=A0A2S2CL23_9PROT|nr:hypothetical protein DEW08_02580 [Azospirillum thermophilum]